jgi:hypothetical protein
MDSGKSQSQADRKPTRVCSFALLIKQQQQLYMATFGLGG